MAKIFGPSTLIDGMQKRRTSRFAYDNNAMGVLLPMHVLNKYEFSREDQRIICHPNPIKDLRQLGQKLFWWWRVPVEVLKDGGEPNSWVTKDEEYNNVKIDKIPSLDPLLQRRYRNSTNAFNYYTMVQLPLNFNERRGKKQKNLNLKPLSNYCLVLQMLPKNQNGLLTAPAKRHS